MLVKGGAPVGVRVGPGGHGEGVGLGQFVVAAAVQMLFQQTQQEGGNQRHGEIARHFHRGRGEVEVTGAHCRPVRGEEIREADDEHHRGVLHVDDEVVADLGHDVADGLGQDYAGHGLYVGHADGHGALGLTGIDGDNAAPDGLCHIGTGVDGHHHDGGGPDAVELHGIVGEIGQAVVEEHRLQHHGGAAEDFHVNADHGPDQGQEEPLDGRIILGMGDGVEHTADKADDAADQRGHQRQDQSVADAGQIVGSAVFGPELCNIGSQLGKFLHGNRLPSVNKS